MISFALTFALIWLVAGLLTAGLFAAAVRLRGLRLRYSHDPFLLVIVGCAWPLGLPMAFVILFSPPPDPWSRDRSPWTRFGLPWGRFAEGSSPTRAVGRMTEATDAADATGGSTAADLGSDVPPADGTGAR